MKGKSIFIFGGIGAVVIFGLWIGSFFAINYIYPKINESGTFGDTFGAINALFSGLAFLGVIVTILLQSQELKLQREELKMTREELKKSAEAQEKQFKLQIHINKLNAYTAYLESLKKEKNNHLNIMDISQDDGLFKKLKDTQEKTIKAITELEKDSESSSEGQ